MKRIFTVLVVPALMAVMLVTTAGVAFAKINPCPPQQQPTGDITVCERGGEGGPGGGSGGQTEGSFDIDEETLGVQISGQQRGGGGGPGGGGGGNRSTDLTSPGPGEADAEFEVAGGNSETGGGHCRVTVDETGITGEPFVKGKSCPEFLEPFF